MLTVRKIKVTLDREIQSLPQTFSVKTNNIQSLIEYLKPAHIVKIEEKADEDKAI